MSKRSTPESIRSAKLLLVEGKDEVYLFSELLSDLELMNSIQIFPVGGKDKFPDTMSVLRLRPDFHQVQSIGIIRDADNDPAAAFQSICSCLQHLRLPVPKAPLLPKAGPPRITVMIVPDIHVKGMLEDVCLNSVSDDAAMECVEQYFQCLQSHARKLAETALPKARVRAFLASREWLEIAHFEYLQKCMEGYLSVSPQSSAVAVPKVHSFLASRYTPNLDLGMAAQKSGSDDRYWQFDHPAFDKIKQFLQLL